jgi:hypothetical protein
VILKNRKHEIKWNSSEKVISQTTRQTAETPDSRIETTSVTSVQTCDSWCTKRKTPWKRGRRKDVNLVALIYVNDICSLKSKQINNRCISSNFYEGIKHFHVLFLSVFLHVGMDQVRFTWRFQKCCLDFEGGTKSQNCCSWWSFRSNEQSPEIAEKLLMGM